VKRDAVRREALQMENGRDHPLSAEPIQRPVKSASAGVIEHLAEGSPVGFAPALMLDVFPDHFVARSIGELA
jgi:hypothetical protein